MPTKTKSTEQPIDTSTMNVWAKLSTVRGEFEEAGTKKSGKNLHAEFIYFELTDIVPIAEPLFRKYNLFLSMFLSSDSAIAEVVDIDNPEQRIDFSIPVKFISEPAKFRMNEIQGVGAAVTYYRRYLYMLVLDLIENDALDGDDNLPPPAEPPKKLANSDERSEIKKTLTNAEGNADELQIKALKAALTALRKADSSQEEFIQTVALKTNSFTTIDKAACEKLILTVNQMIDEINGKNE